jgi:rubrerythrin
MKIRKISQKLENVKELEPLSDRELARAIRDAIIAEEEAIKQYETIADSTSDAKAREVLQEIADEEKVHVGELQQLLDDMLENEEELFEEGRKEVLEKDASSSFLVKTAMAWPVSIDVEPGDIIDIFEQNKQLVRKTSKKIYDMVNSNMMTQPQFREQMQYLYDGIKEGIEFAKKLLGHVVLRERAEKWIRELTEMAQSPNFTYVSK